MGEIPTMDQLMEMAARSRGEIHKYHTFRKARDTYGRIPTTLSTGTTGPSGDMTITQARPPSDSYMGTRSKPSPEYGVTLDAMGMIGDERLKPQLYVDKEGNPTSDRNRAIKDAQGNLARSDRGDGGGRKGVTYATGAQKDLYHEQDLQRNLAGMAEDEAVRAAEARVPSTTPANYYSEDPGHTPVGEGRPQEYYDALREERQKAQERVQAEHSSQIEAGLAQKEADEKRAAADWADAERRYDAAIASGEIPAPATEKERYQGIRNMKTTPTPERRAELAEEKRQKGIDESYGAYIQEQGRKGIPLEDVRSKEDYVREVYTPLEERHVRAQEQEDAEIAQEKARRQKGEQSYQARKEAMDERIRTRQRGSDLRAGEQASSLAEAAQASAQALAEDPLARKRISLMQNYKQIRANLEARPRAPKAKEWAGKLDGYRRDLSDMGVEFDEAGNITNEAEFKAVQRTQDEAKNEYYRQAIPMQKYKAYMNAKPFEKPRELTREEVMRLPEDLRKGYLQAVYRNRERMKKDRTQDTDYGTTDQRFGREGRSGEGYWQRRKQEDPDKTALMEERGSKRLGVTYDKRGKGDTQHMVNEGLVREAERESREKNVNQETEQTRMEALRRRLRGEDMEEVRKSEEDIDSDVEFHGMKDMSMRDMMASIDRNGGKAGHPMGRPLGGSVFAYGMSNATMGEGKTCAMPCEIPEAETVQDGVSEKKLDI